MTMTTALQSRAERTGASGDPGDPRCVAVIVHWRGAADTRRCLASLRADAADVPAVVVDNASEDGSGTELAARLAGDPLVVIVRADANRGFGAGCNLGVQVALERWPGLGCTLLVNPDVVLEPGCIAALLDTSRRHSDAGIVGGRVLGPDGRRVLYENGRIRRLSLSRCHAPAPCDREEYPTEFVTGALMLVDARVWRSGLAFDERYFLYVEDLDLCIAARRAGWQPWVTRRAAARHDEGGSQRGDRAVLGVMRATQLEHMTRGKVLFARKWLRPHERVAFWFSALLLKPVLGLLLAPGPRFLPAYVRGLAAGMRERVR